MLATRDRQLLLDERKLALIVDLDQTLIHTSMNPAIPTGLPVSVGIPWCAHMPILKPQTHTVLSGRDDEVPVWAGVVVGTK